MALNQLQLQDILIDFERQMREANRLGTIFDFLKEHNIAYDEFDECPYDKKRARLLIAGQASIPPSVVKGILSSMGIDTSRVDMVLEYDGLQKFKWSSLQYSFKYSDVIFGSMGHSSEGKGDYSSIIARMEQEDGWPNVIRATANSELKITKQSLKDAITKSEFYKKNLSSYH